jgi:hypothetical protein
VFFKVPLYPLVTHSVHFLFHFLVATAAIMLAAHNLIVALFCNSAFLLCLKPDRLFALDFEN